MTADLDDSQQRRSEEVELKFAYEDADALREWFDNEFPPQADNGWRTIEITDLYFDTADLALKEAGLGARLRTIGPRRH